MREILLRSCPMMLWVIAALEGLFVILALRGWKGSRKPLTLLTALVAFGLFYDALILALGGVMKEGALLLTLSRLRFVLHGALIPLLFAICAYALDFNKTWKTIVWVFTGLLIALGIAEGSRSALPRALPRIWRYSMWPALCAAPPARGRPPGPTPSAAFFPSARWSR